MLTWRTAAHHKFNVAIVEMDALLLKRGGRVVAIRVVVATVVVRRRDRLRRPHIVQNGATRRSPLQSVSSKAASASVRT